MSTIRLTMAQALIRFLAVQGTVCDGREVPLRTEAIIREGESPANESA